MPKIELKNVSIDFPIYGSSMSFRTELMQIATGGLIRRDSKNRRVTVRSLDNISLMIKEGDLFGDGRISGWACRRLTYSGHRKSQLILCPKLLWPLPGR